MKNGFKLNDKFSITVNDIQNFLQLNQLLISKALLWIIYEGA